MSGTFDPTVTVDFGMVQDGTSCGQEMICMNQTCISLRPLKTYTRCPVDALNNECSGRGVSLYNTRSVQICQCVCLYQIDNFVNFFRFVPISILACVIWGTPATTVGRSCPPTRPLT
jgi:hypothetical protein